MRNNAARLKKTVEGFLTNLLDLFILNLLFIAFSIPIFTIGASQTALCKMMFNKREGKIVKLIKGFIDAFKENFKQATIIWLIILFLFADGFILHNYVFANNAAAGMILKIAGIILALIGVHIFAIQAYFKNSIKQTFINAAAISSRFLPTTILMALICATAFAFTYVVFPPALFVVFSAVAYFNSIFLHRILIKLCATED